MEENGLISLAQQGNIEAFEQLYRKYVKKIYSLSCRMTTDTHLAENLTQEVFERVWIKIGTFRGGSHFLTWLYRLAVNLILRRMKGMNPNKSVSLDFEIPSREGDLQDHIPVKIDLEKALQTLPIRCRTVMIFHDSMGKKHDEIRKIMGISLGTSKAHLHRARKLMKEALES